MKDYYLGERSKTGGSGLKRAKPVLISAGALLVLMILGGLAYTWYNGQQPVKLSTAAQSPQTDQHVIKATIPDKKTQESAAVEVLTSPVAPGDNAMISVKTNATSTCKISVVYNNVPSADSGLGPKKADDFGTVSWAWTVPKSTPLGSWPVTVTCQFYDKSAGVSKDLRVVKNPGTTATN